MKRSRNANGKVDYSVLSVATRPSGESSRIVQIERFVFMLDREICDLYVDNKYPSAGRMISGGGPYCWAGNAPNCEYLSNKSVVENV